MLKIPEAPTAEWLEKHNVRIIGCRAPKAGELGIPLPQPESGYWDPTSTEPYRFVYDIGSICEYARWILEELPEPTTPPTPTGGWDAFTKRTGAVLAEPSPRVPTPGVDYWLSDTGLTVCGPDHKPYSSTFNGVRWILKRAPMPDDDWLKQNHCKLTGAYARPNGKQWFAGCTPAGGLDYTVSNSGGRSSDDMYGGFRWICEPVKRSVEEAVEAFPPQYTEAAQKLVEKVRTGPILTSALPGVTDKENVPLIAALLHKGLFGDYNTYDKAIAGLGCQAANARRLIDALAEEAKDKVKP